MLHRTTFEHDPDRLLYRVAASCTGCEVCETFARGIFVRIPGTDQFRVSRQPETPKEERQCEEALEHCHMHVIRKTTGS